MPLIIGALWAAFLSILPTLVGRILISMGIGFATFTGASALLTWAKNQFLSGMAGIDSHVLGLVHNLQIGTCVSMILSAITMRLTIAGLSAGGAITKMIQK